MIYRGRVNDGVVVFDDPNFNLPEGTAVKITLVPDSKKRDVPEKFGPDGFPCIEVPNKHIADCASQCRNATVRLHELQGALVAPILTLGGLALELYLKSLNATLVYTSLPSGGYKIDQKALRSEHDLVKLCDALDPNLKEKLDQFYTGHPIAGLGPTFREALSFYRTAFEDSRYIYERGKSLPEKYGCFVPFVQLLGRFVEQLQPGYIT